MIVFICDLLDVYRLDILVDVHVYDTLVLQGVWLHSTIKSFAGIQDIHRRLSVNIFYYPVHAAMLIR